MASEVIWGHLRPFYHKLLFDILPQREGLLREYDSETFLDGTIELPL